MTQEENIAYNHLLGIQVEAWGPFGQGDIDVVIRNALYKINYDLQKVKRVTE